MFISYSKLYSDLKMPPEEVPNCKFFRLRYGKHLEYENEIYPERTNESPYDDMKYRLQGLSSMLKINHIIVEVNDDTISDCEKHFRELTDKKIPIEKLIGRGTPKPSIGGIPIAEFKSITINQVAKIIYLDGRVEYVRLQSYNDGEEPLPFLFNFLIEQSDDFNLIELEDFLYGELSDRWKEFGYFRLSECFGMHIYEDNKSPYSDNEEKTYKVGIVLHDISEALSYDEVKEVYGNISKAIEEKFKRPVFMAVSSPRVNMLCIYRNMEE